jgi:hypothetical protein
VVVGNGWSFTCDACVRLCCGRPFAGRRTPGKDDATGTEANLGWLMLNIAFG